MPKANPTGALAWHAEETCGNAWPALREIVLEGWLVRFAEGVSRRLNSANPLSARAAASDAVIAETEAFYRRHEQPAIFRVPTLCPPAVERALDKRGYTAEGETCVLHGSLDAMDSEIDPEIVLRPRADRIWFAAMAGLQGYGAEAAHTYRRIVGAISLPASFASLANKEGRIVSMAYGAIHNGMLCYDMVVTDARERRRGHSHKIVTALAGWAKARGATGACLQVVADNMPAKALYDAIGLKTELYRYQYWRAPSA
ncbi:MAG TPA: GNAT family N-acetyltransferase [Stellaceae bacterium]|nr:GNAT family N-acetyltransferase [Stellaceae bacterium]